MRDRLELAGWALAGCALALLCVGFRIVVAGGGSMEPALVKGDICLVASHRAPRQGDIVLYALPGHRPVMHRVVSARARGGLKTRGDANPTSDAGLVPRACVSGSVVAVLPLGKAVRGWWRATGMLHC